MTRNLTVVRKLDRSLAAQFAPLFLERLDIIEAYTNETVGIGPGESFGHPVLPRQLNPMLRELSIANDDKHDELIEAIVMHPDFDDNYLQLAFDKYKNNPCAYRFNELTGCMLVYQWLDKA